MVPRLLVFLVSLGVRALSVLCRSKAELVVENLALRQQIATLVRARTRPAIDDAECAFWVALRASWAGWASRLFIAQADTVARRHRERFRRHWARISREQHRPGRPRIDVELRQLIRDMAGNRDAIFSPAVVRFVKAMGTKPRRISYRSPWQNPAAERWIGSCRRELLALRRMSNEEGHVVVEPRFRIEVLSGEQFA